MVRKATAIARITKTGKCLVDINFFGNIQCAKQEFKRLLAELGKVYDGIDPAIAEVEIAEAIENIQGNRMLGIT